MSDSVPELGLTIDQKKILLSVAQETIHAKAFNKRLRDFSYPDDIFKENRGGFVTLHKNGDLRGCIGYVFAVRPLLQTVVEMADAAAFRDPRFPPVEKDEVMDLEIEISVLSPLKEVMDINKIEIGIHGIMLENGVHTGLLLPQVAPEWGWDRIEFLERTCQKAGIAKDDWMKKGTIIKIFSADIFCEKDFA
jgi:AmmeMemoRadiSam system protein A